MKYMASSIERSRYKATLTFVKRGEARDKKNNTIAFRIGSGIRTNVMDRQKGMEFLESRLKARVGGGEEKCR